MKPSDAPLEALDYAESAQDNGEEMGERRVYVNEDQLPTGLLDTIRADYRNGTTLRRCSEIYSVDYMLLYRVRKRESWKQDFSADVRAEVQARLAAESVGLPSPSEASTETLIDAAATRGASVVGRHRMVLERTILNAHEIAEKLKGMIDAQAQAATPDLKIIATLSGALLNVGNTLARTVPLERIAHGLNEKDEEKPYEERLREFYAKSEAERKARRAERQAGG